MNEQAARDELERRAGIHAAIGELVRRLDEHRASDNPALLARSIAALEREVDRDPDY